MKVSGFKWHRAWAWFHFDSPSHLFLPTSPREHTMTFRILIGGFCMLMASEGLLAAPPSPLRFNLPDRSYTYGPSARSRVIAPRFGTIERGPRYSRGMRSYGRRVPITAPRSSISFRSQRSGGYSSYRQPMSQPRTVSPQRFSPAMPQGQMNNSQIPVLQRDGSGREFIVSGGQRIYFD